MLLLLVLFLPLILAQCPSGTIYESNFNKCYKFVDQFVTFLAAEKTCERMGGHLVAIQNGFENSYISGLVQGSDPIRDAYWIGANYLLATSWTWTYNATFSYINWAGGQPSDPSIYQCGEVRTSTYYWYKQTCNAARPFVCSMDPYASTSNSTCPPSPTCPACVATTPTPSCPPEPNGNATCDGLVCPKNYTMSPVDCKCYYWVIQYYWAYDAVLSFNDSLKFCQSQGASLAKITSKAQDLWLANWIQMYEGHTYPWIGLTCPGSTKESCYWADGSPLTCYDNFDTEYSDGSFGSWNGNNRHFFLRSLNIADDFGQWYRWNDDSTCTVLCMQDPQRQ